MIKCLTLVVALLSSSAVSPQSKKPQPASQPAASKLYDFKGVPLGITLAEFRALPHPDGGDARVLCTGEKVPITSTYSSEPVDVMLFDEVEKALGVTKCIWVAQGGDRWLEGQIKGLNLAGSMYAANQYSFSFMPDPVDRLPRLYRFQGVSNRNAADDVIEALTQKWGAPKLVKDKVQNKMGASFDQLTALWDNPAASILVQDRWTKIDNMVIIFSDKRLTDIYDAAEKAKKQGTPNRI